MHLIVYTLKALGWRAYIAWLAVQWAPQFNLGDRVVYRGAEWTLIQGVAHPTWTLVRGESETVEANVADFHKVRSLSNYVGSIRSGYRFYMTSWYRIWMREGILPWMRGCSIWPGRQ